MKKEDIIKIKNINNYGIYNEYYGIANIFNRLWKAKEYIQKEIIQQNEMELERWTFKKNEELKKDNIEVLSEKGKLIFKCETGEFKLLFWKLE